MFIVSSKIIFILFGLLSSEKSSYKILTTHSKAHFKKKYYLLLARIEFITNYKIEPHFLFNKTHCVTL